MQTFAFGRYRRAALLGVVSLLAGVVSCEKTTTRYIDVPIDPEEVGDAGTFDARPSADSGLGILSFQPDTLFSGYDGVHPFTVPIAVHDSSDDLVVTVSDSTAATVTPKKLTNPVKNGVTDSGKWFFVAIKRSGTVTLKATSKGKTAEAVITVQDYDPGRWAIGDTRYKNGGMGDPPCTDCHVNGKAIDHSPAALAGVSDEKVAITITTGISPGGFAIKIDGKASHRWRVSDTERDGLITYLRSLDPKGFQ